MMTNRREALKSVFKKPIPKTKNAATPLGPSVVSCPSLTEEFDFAYAKHLLNRTMFGPTLEQINQAVEMGLNATIDQLFAQLPLPDEPVHILTNDPNVPQFTSWVNKHYEESVSNQLRGSRVQSLQSWTMKVFLEEGVSIREKMTLFWHNHFPVAEIFDAVIMYNYMHLLRSNATGNFKELTKAVAIDPCMLRYLDGRENSKEHANENFARELLELFTIGKGPLIGPGNYTNYRELDVTEGARILTGWRDVGFMNTDSTITPTAKFVNSRHDTTEKQLSEAFDSAVIPVMGDEEYKHYIDIIFAKPECARFICRKLYRWFVASEISEVVEMDIIGPMAETLIADDYEVANVLKLLLKSQHFYSAAAKGVIIKSPLDFILSIMKPAHISFPQNDTIAYYRILVSFLSEILPPMQQVVYELPSVAGWKAYHQSPAFYRSWISSSTLPYRKNLSKPYYSMV